MNQSSFAVIIYKGEDRQVTWRGIKMEDKQNFDTFIARDVASRLYDTEGHNEFETYLQGLAPTGFAQESLNAILAAQVPEERDWAIGESLAEAYLHKAYQVTWPWNMERDKRHPNASLPGADLIGFRIEDEDTRLVLGEVKSSSNPKTPPGVMNGRGGMTHQIDNLATNLSLICQILKWLLSRCKGTEHENSFNKAVKLFLNSGNKAITLIGVLIRDTQPNERDLRPRGQTLAKKLQNPTLCHLMAIYLPCAIADLPSRLQGGAS